MEEGYWSRRITRRSAVRLGAVAGLGFAGASIIGCGGDDATSQPTSTGTSAPTATATSGSGTATATGTGTATSAPSSVLEDYRTRFHYSKLKDVAGQADGPKQGGTYRFSTFPLIDWDITGPSADVLAAFAPHHFNGLLTFAQDDFANVHNLYNPIGDLAASWEVVDELTTNFTLHEGVKFHNLPPVNGRAMVADDVKFCFDIYKTTVAQGPIFADVGEIAAPDPATVNVKFVKPAAYFLQELLYPVSLIFAKEAYEDRAGFAATPIGTGPYLLDQYDPTSIYSGSRFPDYFRKDPRTGMALPYNDGFEAPLTGGNVPLEESAFRDGSLDTIWTHTKSAFDRMMETFPGNVGQVTTPPPGYFSFIVLKLDKPPFNDQRVRAALQHMIDMQALIDGPAEGLADPGIAHDFSFFGREWPWSLEELNAMGGNYAYDPQMAKQLLSAAGIEGALPLKMIYDAGDNLLVESYRLIVNFWKQNGVEVQSEEISIADFARIVNTFYGKDYGDLDAVGYENSGPGIDEDQYSYGALNSKSARNVYWVNDPEIDALTEKQRGIFDIEERRKICLEVIERDLSQSYRIWGILPYKLAVRRGYSYNIVDTIHAWANLGWGAKSDEMVWYNRT